MGNELFSYWIWFFRGSGEKAGYRRIINTWIILHFFVGIVLSVLVQITLESSAKTVLLPLAGIFVALTFAWVGNTMALMQSPEIDKLSKYHPGGFTEYAFVYQTAILVILTTLILWGLAGLQVFDSIWPRSCNKIAYFMIKTFLFTLSSLTLRECWHVVMGAQLMLLVQREIKSRLRKGDEGSSN
jgi:hypothetical protein